MKHKAGFYRLKQGVMLLSFIMLGSLAHAGLITAPSILANGGSIQATQTAPNAFHVTFTPPENEVEAVQKVYYALFLNGHIYFQTLDGSYHEWNGGEMAPMYENAQSSCRTGNSFGFTSSFGGVGNLDEIGAFLPAGVAFYAGYGASQEDMVVNGKYAPVYVVVK